MKKSLFAISAYCILSYLLAPQSVCAQQIPIKQSPARKEVIWSNPADTMPLRITHHEIDSPAMGRLVGYSVYLPLDYNALPEKRYPVAYFLHGSGGNENSDGPGFAGFAERLCSEGHVPPIICVFPNGGMSEYRDYPDSGINVETMIIDELIPLIDQTYRTLPKRESRVIAGYSMGGGGAIRLSLTHPEKFSAAASWAAALVWRKTGDLHPEYTTEFLGQPAPLVRLMLIVGYLDETTYPEHADFLRILEEANYPYTYRTLRDVPHKLGKYHELAGKDLVRFLLQDIETN